MTLFIILCPCFLICCLSMKTKGSAPVRRCVKKVLEKLMVSFALSTMMLAAAVSLVVRIRGGLSVVPHESQIDLLEC